MRRHLVRSVLGIALLTTAAGCTTHLVSMQQHGLTAPNVMQHPHLGSTLPPGTELKPVLLPPSNSYAPRYTHKRLDGYAEQMTMALMAKARLLSAESRVGVASFVNFDADLTTTNPLGNQLAESFIREVQAYGLAVVDYKTTSKIRVEADGDKVFSRNADKLSRAKVDFVLSGTMHPDTAGVRVNARIISMDDRRVVASASGFIPHFVASAVVPEYVLLPSIQSRQTP